MPLQTKLLHEILRTSYRTEGKVDALTDRVDRIEDREFAKRSSAGPEWTPRDYMIAAAGGLVLALAVIGKAPWSVVQSFLSVLK